jgi:5'-nucleotidase
MSSGHSTTRRVAALAAFSLVPAALAGLPLATSASATPDGDALVISEVYGGGGNSGAIYTHDYVELYNPTDAAIDLAGLSIQYRSSANTNPPSSGGVTSLAGAGSVPAGEHFVVRLASQSTVGAPVPNVDFVGNTATNLSGSNGQVYLARSTTAIDPDGTGNTAITDPAVIDFVGFGSAAIKEGAAAAPSPAGNATSISRDDDGTDTDSNSADFVVSDPPTPGTPYVAPPPDPGPVVKTIAEIQGTGSASPLVGENVTTTGVVTAVYDTGGLDGLVIQTPGATVGDASHGLFVYTRNGSRAGLADLGDTVAVTGRVSEYFGQTQLTVDSDEDLVVTGAAAQVTPAAVVWPDTDQERERLESMLLAPSGDFTVTDNYSLNQYGELGLAAGTEPLRQPTDVGPVGSPAYEETLEQNAARGVLLDDGASLDFIRNDGAKDVPLPYLTQDPTIRVGEAVMFAQPVVLGYGFDRWRFQPQSQLTGDEQLPATFGDTRTASPEDVGGDVQVASFNVLNYFPTTGAEWVASGAGSCSFYRDRDGDEVTNDRCNPDGPRGAAEQEDLARQQAKIVKAINGLGAEVVSLEEIENSVHFGKDRDAAMAHLVAALNAEAGARTWAYVPSPTDVPSPEREDVIRNGFIYQQDVVVPQGESVIYDGPEFDNARDPLAQVFKPKAGNAADKFILVVNHFKSKGSACKGEADGPQGNCNETRVAQAQALVEFADRMKDETDVAKVYLDGDFNSYTHEDPMQVLHDAGYTNLHVLHETEASYLFDGLVGSLDHALANDAALGTTTGATVWTINAYESVALEYSRYNYNVTDFYDESVYRSSDHNPVVFGVAVTKATTAPAGR